MSYELSGFSTAPAQFRREARTARLIHPMKLTRATKLLLPARVARTTKRRTPPRMAGMTISRLPASAVQASNLSGLGFSLKPPKFIRKLTIKKVIKPLAITAAVVGAALIPGALPLVGKAVGLIGKGAIGGAKLATKYIARPIIGGVTSVFQRKSATVIPQTTVDAQAVADQAAQLDALRVAANAQAEANRAAQEAASQAAYDAQVAANQTGGGGTAPIPTYAPQSVPSYGGGSGGGGGGYSPAAMQSPTPSEPSPAGFDVSSLVPIGIGLVALVAVSGALNRGRR